MILEKLIRGEFASQSATANLANHEPEKKETALPLAGLATLAVANSPKDGIRESDIQTPRQQDNRDTLLKEQRRNRVLAMLAEEPDKSRAVCTDMDSDPDNVILTLAIRYVATCELRIPKEQYDPFQIMGMLDHQDICPVH